MGDPIEKSRSHFCIPEDRDPFLKIQICGEDHDVLSYSVLMR